MQYCRGESGESCWIGSLIQFSFHYRALDARLESRVIFDRCSVEDSESIVQWRSYADLFAAIVALAHRLRGQARLQNHESAARYPAIRLQYFGQSEAIRKEKGLRSLFAR